MYKQPRDLGKNSFSMDDISLPKSTVTRLAKASAFASVNASGPVLMQKDANTALQKSAVVFLNYIATNANDITLKAGRKVISPADMIQSIERDFPAFSPRLHQELEAYNLLMQEKKANKAEGGARTVDGDNGKSHDSHIVKKMKLNIGQNGTSTDSGHGSDTLSGDAGADAETVDDLGQEIDSDNEDSEPNEQDQASLSPRHEIAFESSPLLHHPQTLERTESA